MDSMTDAIMLASTRSRDSNASAQNTTSSRQVDSESVDEFEKVVLSKEELELVITKLQMIEAFASQCEKDGEIGLQELKSESQSKARASLNELHLKLKSQEEQVDALKSTCDRLYSMDKNKFQHICRLEEIINMNENVASEKILLKSESCSLKSKLETLQASSCKKDSFILEKLHLAYQDLTAIYDLRAEIGQLLDEIHEGIFSPQLQKSIIRLVREKELALHNKNANN
jgi:hypothetical protein